MPENVKIKFDKSIINQAEIARRLQISNTYVCLLVSGKRKNVKYIHLINDIVEKSLKRSA